MQKKPKYYIIYTMQRQKVDYKFLFSDLNISEEILYLCRHKLKAINQGGGGGLISLSVDLTLTMMA